MNFLDPRLPDRFWQKCIPEPNSGCWLWIGAKNGRGYPRFMDSYAHRISLAVSLGLPTIGDRFACHHCDVEVCVNPQHLYAGTPQSNVADMVARGRVNMDRLRAGWELLRAKTHCPNGHPYDGDNLERRPRGGWSHRRCRECHRAQERARYARRGRGTPGSAL